MSPGIRTFLNAFRNTNKLLYIHSLDNFQGSFFHLHVGCTGATELGLSLIAFSGHFYTPKCNFCVTMHTAHKLLQ